MWHCFKNQYTLRMYSTEQKSHILFQFNIWIVPYRYVYKKIDPELDKELKITANTSQNKLDKFMFKPPQKKIQFNFILFVVNTFELKRKNKSIFFMKFAVFFS